MAHQLTRTGGGIQAVFTLARLCGLRRKEEVKRLWPVVQGFCLPASPCTRRSPASEWRASCIPQGKDYCPAQGKNNSNHPVPPPIACSVGAGKSCPSSPADLRISIEPADPSGPSVQWRPPFWDGRHSRCRTTTPRQSSVQLDHVAHSRHWPSTIRARGTKIGGSCRGIISRVHDLRSCRGNCCSPKGGGQTQNLGEFPRQIKFNV